MGRSRDGGGRTPAAGRDERRPSRRGPRAGRGRRRPRPRAGGGLRQRPPHLPPAVARRADPPRRGRGPRRRDGPRHDGRAALAARTRPARRGAHHPGHPRAGPGRRRRRGRLVGGGPRRGRECRSTTAGRSSRSPCTSCAGCWAADRCRPGGSRSSTVPGRSNHPRRCRSGSPAGGRRPGCGASPGGATAGSRRRTTPRRRRSPRDADDSRRSAPGSTAQTSPPRWRRCGRGSPTTRGRGAGARRRAGAARQARPGRAA